MKKYVGTGQAGDTLVEVLIAILIVSVILTGAYVTTNRSALGVRNSQEQAEALKLIQGQLEQVRQNGAESGDVFDRPENQPFCMVNAAIVNAVSGPQVGQCTQNSAGQPTTDQPAYKLTVQREECVGYNPPNGETCHAFTTRVVWDSLTTGGQANSIITYRLYE